MDVRLWKAVDRRFMKLDFKGAVRFLEETLAKERNRLFKGLLSKGFTNAPKGVLAAINKFINACSQEFDIKAVYLEMNGFDINPDRWYFDFFGYSMYGPNARNLEWICDWQSSDWPDVTLRGLEDVQADFEWYQAKEVWKDKKHDRTYRLAILLVMSKFARLVETALEAGPRSKSIPILAAAHDFDIVGWFNV